MNVFKPLSFLILLLITTSCSQKEVTVLDPLNFNKNWFFIISEDAELEDKNYLETTDFSNWDSVSLPHTPKIEPKIVNNQWQGISSFQN